MRPAPAPGLRRGVWLFPSRPAGELVECVIAAEEAGLDEVWIADEGVARDPVSVLAAAARETSHVLLATGITSPLLRHPGALASALTTVDELSDGRAILGLGLGGDLSLGPFGITTDRPVGVVADAIRLARSVIDRSDGPGYAVPKHAAPRRRVPIWVGARGRQMTAMAARLADGVFVSGCSRDEHDRIAADVAAAGSTGLALYQTAASAPARPSELSWDDVGSFLATEIERLGPTSVGVNLVDAIEPGGADPIELVDRAAALLRDLP